MSVSEWYLSFHPAADACEMMSEHGEGSGGSKVRPHLNKKCRCKLHVQIQPEPHPLSLSQPSADPARTRAFQCGIVSSSTAPVPDYYDDTHQAGGGTAGRRVRSASVRAWLIENRVKTLRNPISSLCRLQSCFLALSLSSIDEQTWI